MDRQNNTPENQDWVDEILGAVESAAEIGPDEQAISSAGLTHPDDLQLERILNENWDEVPNLEVSEKTYGATMNPDINRMFEEEWEDTVSRTAPQPQAAPAQTGGTTLVPQPALEQEPVLEEDTESYTRQFTPAEEPQEEPEVIAEQEPEQPQEEEPVTEAEPEPVQKQIPPEAAPKRKKKAEPKKTRPGFKKGYGLLGIPHVLSTVIWLALILVIGISLGRMLWVSVADLLAFGKPDEEVTITIEEGDSLDVISKKLADADLIRYPGLFKMFAQATGKDENISAGTHSLNSKYDYNAMINAMTSYTSREEVEVMIPEGYTCAQIFRLLEEKEVCSVAELEAYAATGELDDYWFLEGVTRGDRYCLEGYLFPDTYKFYKNDEPRRVLEKLLDDFDYRFTDRMKENFVTMQERWADMLFENGYGSEYVANHPLTIHKIVTLASIVEEETASATESYAIASVFYNRLASPDFPYLDSDATVYYAIGAYFEREELTSADLAIDSPYNTRKSTGLPPGPISNPGLSSLYAALDPDDSNYYYFIYDESISEHRFSATLREHNEWAEKLGD